MRDTFGVIAEHQPDIIGLECVPQLAQVSKAEDGDGDAIDVKLSDAQFISDQLKQMGYWSFMQVVASKEQGNYKDRSRLYWVGWPVLSKSSKPSISGIL